MKNEDISLIVVGEKIGHIDIENSRNQKLKHEFALHIDQHFTIIISSYQFDGLYRRPMDAIFNRKQCETAFWSVKGSFIPYLQILNWNHRQQG